MKAYGKRMFEDPMDGVYPSRAIFGKKRLKALKRKLRSRKKEARRHPFPLQCYNAMSERKDDAR